MVQIHRFRLIKRTINCKGSQINLGLELDHQRVSIIVLLKKFNPSEAVKMNYLAINNVLSGGIAVFFKKAGIFCCCCYLGRTKCSIAGVCCMKASDKSNL